MTAARHILINALSISSGGGYTVGREVMRNLAEIHPEWMVTMALIEGFDRHTPMAEEDLPGNCKFLWAPDKTRGRMARIRWEGGDLVRWADEHNVDAVYQLNGMMIKSMGPPTFAHFQDPWPYRPEAWATMKDRGLAMLKRRANIEALRNAACCGFTSQYLYDLITGYHGVKPRRGGVFHNGIPDEWIDRASAGLPDWSSRPMNIVTVSGVDPYKRQDLVIDAVGKLVQRPGLEKLKYNIIGYIREGYEETLQEQIDRLGLRDHVSLEGRVSDERVQDALRESRCYVLMSVCESFGIPAIEAMSFGTPVVTSDCCAMPEVCGDAAALCPVDDVDELADLIERAVTDEQYAEQARADGVEQVNKFRWSASVKGMADEIERMMESGVTA